MLCYTDTKQQVERELKALQRQHNEHTSKSFNLKPNSETIQIFNIKYFNVKLYNLNYKFTFNFKAIFLPTKEN
jgi:hypothetical protein